MEFPSASASNSSLTLLGRVADLVKKGATIELQEAIQSLREALLAEKEEKLALREELSSLKRAQQTKAQLVFEDPVYFTIGIEGKKGGAVCAHCFGKDEKLILLSVVEEGLWKCSVCKESFESQDHRTRRMNKPRQGRAIVSRGPNSWMER
jgi:hypothetical protein